MVQLLFGFNGRINRAQYWTASIAMSFVAILIFAALIVNAGLAWSSTKEDAVRALMGVILALIPVYGLMMWVGTALQVKRLHDRGQSGFWALLPAGLGALTGVMPFLIPITLLGCLAYAINLGFLPGQDGDNRFGAPPGTPGGAGSPNGPRPGKAAAAASSMFGAEQAMERALAEQQMRAKAPPAPRTTIAPKPATAAAAAPSFGRRVVQ